MALPASCGHGAIVLVLVLTAAACGGSPSPTPAPSPTPTPAPSPTPAPAPPGPAPAPTPPVPSPSPGPSLPTDLFTAQDGTRYGVQTIVTNLEIPWSMAFAPDGRIFVTERPGRVRIVQSGSLVPQPALVLSDVAAQGEAGLMGIALHPDFAQNQLVYLVYTATGPGGGVNRVVRYREVGGTLGERAVLIDNIPAATIHDGGRIKFGPDRMLYVTMGDAAVASVAQDLASLNGKIYRLNPDGSTPRDNPFGSPIYSYGHRNPQGLDWNPVNGDLWATEHGPSGNDELNFVQAGRNYGWPTIEGAETRSGMETPVLFFTPAIAPSGAAFYRGTAIVAFQHNLFFAALRGSQIRRVRLDPSNPRRVVAHEALVDSRYGRIRDIIDGPDGALYFCTNNRDGRGAPVPTDDRILRIVPPPASLTLETSPLTEP